MFSFPFLLIYCQVSSIAPKHFYRMDEYVKELLVYNARTIMEENEMYDIPFIVSS